MEDIIGKKFGNLTVTRLCGVDKWSHKLYEAKCDCGNTILSRKYALVSGNTKSCGCYALQSRKQLKKFSPYVYQSDHKDRLYSKFHSIKQACYNEASTTYLYYGAKGITVCEEWRNNFQAFFDWAISNGYKEGMYIYRIDKNGNYEPSNCKVAMTAKECNQNRAKKGSMRLYK